MKPIFYMMVGLSGSGKSTYAEKLNAKIISSDAIRAEVFGDVNDQSHNAQVFEILHKRIIECLKNGEDCVYDATNLSAKRRKSFLNSVSHIECEKICCVFATPFEVCVERDNKRNRKVGRRIIFRQMTQFQMPHKYEGWDQIRIIRDVFRNLTDLSSYFCFDTAHDSPYHKETIQEHMQMAAALYEYDSDINRDENVYFALLYHDLGKIPTKVFHDSKGNKTDIAHFYGHERVSAYLYLTSKERAESFDFEDETLYLIQYHMEPYFRNGESWEKFKQNFSEDFVEKLVTVNKYDDLGRKKGEKQNGLYCFCYKN